MSDEEVQVFMNEIYKPALSKLLEASTAINKKDRGFYTSIHEFMQENLEPFGLSIPIQYASDLHAGRKIGKQGMSIPLSYKVSLGLGLSDDPGEALAMLYLALSGVWDPDELPASDIRKLVKSIKKGSLNLEAKPTLQEGPITKRLKRIESLLVSMASIGNFQAPPSALHPVTEALIEASGKTSTELVELSKELFEDHPDFFELVRGVLVEGKDPVQDTWGCFAQLLSLSTGQVWTGRKVGEYLNNLAQQDSSIEVKHLED